LCKWGDQIMVSGDGDCRGWREGEKKKVQKVRKERARGLANKSNDSEPRYKCQLRREILVPREEAMMNSSQQKKVSEQAARTNIAANKGSMTISTERRVLICVVLLTKRNRRDRIKRPVR